MNIVTGIVLYFMIWWLTIFMLLNIGHHTAENPEKGHAASAPTTTHLLCTIIINSILAAVIWLVIYALIKSDIISFVRLTASE